MPKTANPITVRELTLYAENERAIYPQRQAIEYRLWTFMQAGTYDPARAPRLWRYWFEEAAKHYAREFGHPGAKPGGIFTGADLDAAAAEFAAHMEEVLRNGELDEWAREEQARRKAERSASARAAAAPRIRAHRVDRLLLSVFADPAAADPSR